MKEGKAAPRDAPENLMVFYQHLGSEIETARVNIGLDTSLRILRYQLQILVQDEDSRQTPGTKSFRNADIALSRSSIIIIITHEWG